MEQDTARLLGIIPIQAGPEWTIAPHSHGQFEMLVLTAGRHFVRVEGEELWSGPGDVVLFPPGHVHEEHTAEATESRWFCIGFEWARTALPGRHRTHDQTGRMRLLAEWLLAERAAATPNSDRLRGALLHALLAEFLETFEAREHPIVRKVRTHIHQHLAEPITLDALAGVAGRSKYHFLRQYRQWTGLTPIQDVRRIRLEHARDLLVTTDMPLKAIGRMTGLGDIHAFSHAFRQHFQRSPGGLRRPGRGKETPPQPTG